MLRTIWQTLQKTGREAVAEASPKLGMLQAGKRIYAIGDIHGRADLLAQLLAEIRADAVNANGPVTVVGLGDYINRGPDSAEVLRLLRAPENAPPQARCVWLRGNHEWALLAFLQAPKTATDWLFWGGQETLKSYGIAPLDRRAQLRPAEALAAELELTLTERGDLAWLQATVLMHQDDDYAFVHAGVRPRVKLGNQLEHDLLFIRDEWLNQPHGLPCKVVFGHTIFDEPWLLPDRIGIDTGAYQTGNLTCAVLEGANVCFLNTRTSTPLTNAP
jgi:serine/threonine protein phosphatase 1